jgi:bifunctional non-homologous end joining protein LigD
VVSRTQSAKASKRAGATKSGYPGFILPALATLRSSPPVGPIWLHELKFDGYRLQAHIGRRGVKLLTRSGLDWTVKFGVPLASAFADLPVDDAIVDGELVAENASGAPDFNALQDALATGRTAGMVFYAFDLLYLDGRDLRPLPLVQRKEALAGLIAAPGCIRLSEHFDVEGMRLLRHVCRLGLEGVVSKRTDAPYRSGRGKTWIKTKCALRQEFVVAGYVPSTVSSRMIGALVLGYYEKGKLVYAGRVGTGFTHKVASDLFHQLDPMTITATPFAQRLPAKEAKGVRFVRPELVGEVEFRTWTAEGYVRHASFRGMREDKAASEVVRESIET